MNGLFEELENKLLEAEKTIESLRSRNITRAYMSWCAMHHRCLNPKHKQYHRYGGRGIVISERWIDSFETFLNDMGECPKGSTLGRRNNDDGYSPTNCQWENIYQQANNRSNNKIIEFDGKSMTMAQWAEQLGMTYGALQSRLNRNKYPLEVALNPQSQKRQRAIKEISAWRTEKRVCKICEAEFYPEVSVSRCCSRKCSKKLWKTENYRRHADRINADMRLKRKKERERVETLFSNIFSKIAELSQCGLYRYSLTREWSDGPCVCFLMFNPSTADENQDDPTIRKCVGFAKRWGYGRMVVLNLYAIRSSDPKAIGRTGKSAIGPLNDYWISQSLHHSREIICAWGCAQH